MCRRSCFQQMVLSALRPLLRFGCLYPRSGAGDEHDENRRDIARPQGGSLLDGCAPLASGGIAGTSRPAIARTGRLASGILVYSAGPLAVRLSSWRKEM